MLYVSWQDYSTVYDVTNMMWVTFEALVVFLIAVCVSCNCN